MRLADAGFPLWVLFVAIPLVIAHRGASAERPENTLAAFRRAVTLKADGIELDVQLTRDGMPVVFHDPGLLRLTGKRGRLTARTWSEIEPLRVLGSKEGIPRLTDVLAFTRRRIVVQIELKKGVAVAPVVAAIKKAKATAWVILASFELELIREAFALAPSIPRMLIAEGRHSPAALLKQLKQCDAHGLSVNHVAVTTKEYATYFQQQGFVVWCWTVNDAASARRLIGWGVDALLGDNPSLLKRLIYLFLDFQSVRRRTCYMILFHHPSCVEYGSSLRPEQPSRISRSTTHLKAAHPDWDWRQADAADESALLTAHTPALIARLQHAPDLDDDTPWYPGIYDHARRAVGAALAATDVAIGGEKTFALMRPPGHHCTRTQAMGFCYLNQIAVAALHASRAGRRVAVWDFDAHHGNGTEDILQRQSNVMFVSVHQSPGYPGTGLTSFDNCRNYLVAPHAPRTVHLGELARSWEDVLQFKPDLVLVSAGFDAFVHDPITQMTLERADFAQLGRWLRESNLPAAAILEGGYSADLPLLIDDFVSAWENPTPLSA